MRRYFNILPLVFALAILSFSACGVKKNATAEVNAAKATQPAKTEQAETAMDIATPKQTETAMDTLPDFLKEFANDSTIHINWAYGIPFIIDDSVPMFLPPIDKNPQGYVSSRNFMQHMPEIAYSYNQSNSELVATTIDSILWLNKCINEVYQYLQEGSIDVQKGHRFGIVFFLRQLDIDQEYIIIDVHQIPYWPCFCRAIACEQDVRYCFDMSGTLIGKFFTTEPNYNYAAKRFSHKVNYIKSGALDSSIEKKTYKLLGLRMYNFYNDCCNHDE